MYEYTGTVVWASTLGNFLLKYTVFQTCVAEDRRLRLWIKIMIRLGILYNIRQANLLKQIYHGVGVIFSEF
jgi:hypothetical protein